MEYGINNEVRVVVRETCTLGLSLDKGDLTHLAERQDKASSETRLTETRRRTTPARPRLLQTKYDMSRIIIITNKIK